MNWMNVTYIMWHSWQGRWKKFKIDFNCYFFLNGKTNNDKALISIEMLLFFETRTAFYANVPAIRVSFCLWQRRLSGLSVFTLQTPRSVFGHCVKQNTKYNLKIKQIYRKLNKWNIRGSSKCAPSAVLQQTIKIKK